MYIKMPLHCNELSSDLLVALNKEIINLRPDHPFRKEGTITVSTQNGYVIFQSEVGFYFRKMRIDVESEIRAEMCEPREYLCSVFEVDEGNDSVIEQLRERFQESHGIKMSRMIEDCVIRMYGKQLMLVKFPGCVLRHMLMPTGGFLRTGFSGMRKNLKQIQTLVQLGQIPDGDDSETIQSFIATEYKEQHYRTAESIHYNILREVVNKPNLGITLKPFALWDS
jgi:hypothetical protein